MFLPRIDEIKKCIACGSDNLIHLLDLNEQPLANSYKTFKDEPEEYFPLATNYCSNCFHVQLTHKVNPDLLFKNYLYVSGTSNTQLKYFEWFTSLCVGLFPDAKTVLDIGCNDGSQLNYFKDKGFTTTGVDPAKNLYELSSKSHHVICDYFNDINFAETLSYDIIICQNAFAHNYDQIGFLQKAKTIMHDKSALFITISQANMIMNNEFDTIYHEHLSFFNINSMNELCKRAGLQLVDVQPHPIHGTSYIFIIQKKNDEEQSIEHLILWEKESGLYNPETYEIYAKKCNEVAESFSKKISEIREQGYTIIGFGAPAKGNTFMNFSKAAPDFIIDENKLKQGLYTPGMSIEIVGIDVIETIENKICFVPLAWNFFDEIKTKIHAVRKRDEDIFLKYFPNVEVI